MHPILFFLQVRNSVKMYHWYTTSYAQHKALDDLTQSLDDLTDRFVEVFIGKYGRPKLMKKDLALPPLEIPTSSASGIQYFDGCIKYLSIELMSYLDARDTDLMNIRDEMLASFNKTKYLFTLQ